MKVNKYSSAIILLCSFIFSLYLQSCKKSIIEKENLNSQVNIKRMNSLIAKNGNAANRLLTTFRTNLLDYKSGKKTSQTDISADTGRYVMETDLLNYNTGVEDSTFDYNVISINFEIQTSVMSNII